MPISRFGVLLGVALLGSAHAATFTVDTTQDSAGLAACTAAPADCSLRGAIATANSSLGADRIEFAIPPGDAGCDALSGVCRIELGADLSVTQALAIDGYTQPGALPNTIPAPGANDAQLRIEITTVEGFNSFRLFNFSGDLELRGLAVFAPSGGMFSNFGTGNSLIVAGNWFGVQASGEAPDYSGDGHVFSLSALHTHVRIGGPDPADRNVLAGSGRDAQGRPGGGSVQLQATSTVDATGSLRVQGNLFGLAPDGVTSLPFDLAVRILTGMTLPTPDIRILDNRFVADLSDFSGGFGGALQFTAVQAMDATALIQGNVFGLAVDGSVPGVDRDHIFFDAGNSSQVHRVQVGGLGPGEGNVFAGARRQAANAPSIGSSLLIQHGLDATRIELVGNSMLGNDGLGLDVPHPTVGGGIALGRSVNDAGDTDTGPNRRQNHPSITAFAVAGDSVEVSYHVDSEPAHSVYPLRVDFYRALGDEGEVLIDSDVYEAADAQQTRDVVLQIPPGVTLDADDVLVAIATDAEGRSSEFSFDRVELEIQDTPDPHPAGLPFEVTVVATASSGPFKPNGVVRVSLNTSPATTCELELVPLGTPNQSAGSCQLVPVQTGLLTLTATYDSLRGAFADAVGGNPVASEPHEVTSAGPEQLGFPRCLAVGLEGRVLELPVARPSGGVAAVQIDLQHEAGSATPDLDYTPPPATTLFWAPGELAPKRIEIPIAADAVAEGVESFRLRLLDPLGAAIQPHAQIEVRILDGDEQGFRDSFEGACPTD